MRTPVRPRPCSRRRVPALRRDVLVARLLDDRPMAVRDKGSLFVIYPFDARPELRSALYYGRSAWQLRTIDVQ